MDILLQNKLDFAMYNMCQYMSSKIDHSLLYLYAMYKFGHEWVSSGDTIVGELTCNGNGVLKILNERGDEYAIINSIDFCWEVNLL